jgi:hypothetical protein
MDTKINILQHFEIYYVFERAVTPPELITSFNNLKDLI